MGKAIPQSQHAHHFGRVRGEAQHHPEAEQGQTHGFRGLVLAVGYFLCVAQKPRANPVGKRHL